MIDVAGADEFERPTAQWRTRFVDPRPDTAVRAAGGETQAERQGKSPAIATHTYHPWLLGVTSWTKPANCGSA
jgi:hypothetical protein